MIIRILLGLIGATVLSVSVFWVLQSLINIDQKKSDHRENIRIIDYVRLQRESIVQKKERIKPKKPNVLDKPVAKTQVLKESVSKKNRAAAELVSTNLDMPLNIDMPLNLSAKGILGDAVVSGVNGGGFRIREVNMDVIPLSRINPVYPRRARLMKIQGYVQVEFTITQFGNVKDVVVVKSHPEGVFDNSAKNAIVRWTFKPKMEEGKAVEQRAGLTINFRLHK